MLQLFKNWKVSHGIMIAFIVLHNFLITLGAYYLSYAINLFQENRSMAYIYVGASVFLELLGVIILYVNNCIEEKTKSEIRLSIRNQLAVNMAGLSLQDFKKKDSSAYVNEQISAVSDFSEEYLDNVYNMIYSFSVVLFGLCFFAKLFLELAIGILLAIICAAIVSRVFSNKIDIWAEKMVEINQEYLKKVSTVFSGLQDIYLYGVGGFFSKKAHGFTYEYEKMRFEYRVQHQKWNNFMYFPMFVVDMLLLLLTIYGILSGKTGIGTLATFLSIEGLILNNSENFFCYLTSMKSGKNMLPEYIGFIKDKEKTKEAMETAENLSNNIGVSVEAAKCVYESNKESKRYHTAFCVGKKYMLQGESGCGKTTLFKLLMKEFEKTEGRIIYTINEQEYGIEQIGEKELSQVVGYLPQAGHLFCDTIYYNIFFDKKVSKEEEKRILSVCQLEEYLQSHEDGINTMICENGKNLSGGEKQRIRLARVLAQKKGLYFLDEPFAGLDARCITYINNYLVNNLDATVVMISHEQRVDDNAKWEIVSI